MASDESHTHAHIRGHRHNALFSLPSLALSIPADLCNKFHLYFAEVFARSAIYFAFNEKKLCFDSYPNLRSSRNIACGSRGVVCA
ncbi:hypothetical protein BX070DRAFT_222538 [Coemansia spiralis]|nr:hypothetical protein BX070DRAFT_222538 [Coemansia spiralis]